MRFVRENDFDVVHTHLVRSTILGTLAARAAGIPVVTTLHNTRPNARLSRALRAMETWLLRLVVDRVVAVGWETARAHHDRLGGRPVEVIPNAVAEAPKLSAAERDAVRRELGVDASQPLVIAVGRLHPQKSYDDLLLAFARVDPGRRAQFRIVGRGGQRTAIEAGIARLGLGDRVQLLGLRRDVPRLLAASDVFASAAGWEGLPVAILEAMAAGLPIVATAVGDVPRVVDESCGTLVPAGQPDQLGVALDRILADPALQRRQGEAGRLRVSRHFGTHAWSSRLIELYREMCRRDDAAEGPARKEDSCASPW
jgi:glycosyltransferase involved in cell wall biosynthesis